MSSNNSSPVNTLNNAKGTRPLQVKFPKLILVSAFLAGSFFAVLLWFYPGPKHLGNDFWPIFGLFAVLALSAGIKLLIQKPILQIDEKGIEFFRSKLFIPWHKVKKVGFIGLAVDGDRTDEKRFLVVQYLDEVRQEIMEIDFTLTGLMNKNEVEIVAALERFSPN